MINIIAKCSIDSIVDYIEDDKMYNLYFITSNKYTYAIDNNNDVRWYLTKKYSKKIWKFN